MDKQYPKFNVVAHWMSQSGLFCVQLVEVAENRLQQMIGGSYAIRVHFADAKGEESMAFTMPVHAIDELRNLLGEASQSAAYVSAR